MLSLKIEDIRMQISKRKCGFVAALIAIAFFSYSSKNSSSYQGGLKVVEKTTEMLAPHGGKETVVVKDYSFNFTKSADSHVTIIKQNGTKKK